mmetsp:Transcript_17408/g.22768  ORF Transcript_17408/g.22768 Transcript_17408/m.22768 type:complete len:838 (-) Transcript_17408:1408-3921(-)
MLTQEKDEGYTTVSLEKDPVGSSDELISETSRLEVESLEDDLHDPTPSIFCPIFAQAKQPEKISYEEKWKRRWTGFLNSFKANVIGGGKGDTEKDVAFSLLLQLYAHKPVIDQLNSMYDQDPKDFMFYLPQLCNALLHGRLSHNESLENLLLDKSAKSLRFAQKLVWFLRSFGPEQIYERGNFVAAVEQNGEQAAEHVPRFQDRISGLPSKQNLPLSITQNSTEKFTSLLLPRLGKGPPYIIGTTKFEWTLSFCNELTNFASCLKEINPEERNLALRTSLESLERDFFPSNVLHLPIGNQNAVVVGIVPEESFCFRTNERVPYMLCLEVICEESIDEYHGQNSETIGNMLYHSLDTIGTQMEEWGHKIADTVGGGSDDISGDPLESMVPAKIKNSKTDMRRGSSDYSPVRAKSESSQSSDSESEISAANQLGQWKPKVNKPRGQGHSHFDFVDQMPKETRQRLSQSFSSGQAPPAARPRAASASASVASRQGTLGLAKPVEEKMEPKKANGTHSHVANGNGSIRSSPDSMSSQDDSEAIEEEGDEKENMVVFRERWNAKEKRIRGSRPWGSEKGWHLVPVIVKADDDLRQEQFALQLITQFDRIFRDAKLGLWLRPYDILATSPTAGLIGAVPDTISLDSLKKNDPNFITLKDFFPRFFGKDEKEARVRFCESLAGYCIVSYLLQIKDRHNGNLLLHAQGYIIHIDFGFILSNSPGNMNFESSPFKLTNEFVQLLGGPDSALFSRFRKLCCQGFLAARKRREEIILLVEMMRAGNEHLPCFKAGGEETVRALSERFQPGLSKTGCVDFVNNLIDTSMNHWRTRWYDRYQRCMVGIAY